VLRWWFLCALDQDCIAPTTDLYCNFQGRQKYGKCHRYDQSALNILLANYFADNYKSYYATNPGVLTVERGSANKEQLAVCRSSRPVVWMKSKSYFSVISWLF